MPSFRGEDYISLLTLHCPLDYETILRFSLVLHGILLRLERSVKREDATALSH